MTNILGQSDLVTLILYLIVGIFGSARITRLVVHDDWPPSLKFRIWWQGKRPGMWEKLFLCHWCFAPWVVLVNMVAAYLFDYWGIQLWWFLINGWLAVSYAASWVVHNDEG